MCRPEIETMWYRFESRISWFVASAMPERSPVIRAAATAPSCPPIPRCIAADSASRTAVASRRRVGARSTVRMGLRV